MGKRVIALFYNLVSTAILKAISLAFYKNKYKKVNGLYFIAKYLKNLKQNRCSVVFHKNGHFPFPQDFR
jgi:hypothetical protein